MSVCTHPVRTEELTQMSCYFDPHIHMVSRTTDDYEMLAKWAASA